MTPDNRPPNPSLGFMLLGNAPLAAMYALGAVLVGWLWWPLALVYLGYGVLANLLFIALVCPYCHRGRAGTCPDGYHLISQKFFRPMESKSFATRFRRSIVVMLPAWVLPPIIGLALLFIAFSWPVAVLLALFCLLAFLILPYISNRHSCRTCESAAECPWYRQRRP